MDWSGRCLSQWTESGSDIYFSGGNVGIGHSSPNDKLDVDGNINTSGEFQRDATGNANMVPVCYGSVQGDGTINTGSNNFSAGRLGLGLYSINIADENFSASSYVVSITPLASVTPHFFTYFSVGVGTLRIQFFDPLLVASDNAFFFVVFKP